PAHAAVLSLSRCRLRRPQGYRTQQVVRQHLPQQHRQHLQPATHPHLVQTTVPRPRVDPLRRRTTLPIHPLRLRTTHPLTPRRYPLRIPRSWHKRIDAACTLLVLILDRRIHLHRMRFMHRLDIVEHREAAIDQHLRGRLTVTLLELLDHLGHLSAVGPGVRHAHTDDPPANGSRGELGVVARPIPPISHLHRPRFGIAGRGPHLLLLGRHAFGPLDFLAACRQLFGLAQGRRHTLLTFTGGPLAGRLLTPRHGGGVLVRGLLERFHFGPPFLPGLCPGWAAAGS